MTEPAPVSPPKTAEGGRVWHAVKAILRTRITAGLITILPLYLTIIMVRFIFQLMRDSSQWIVYGVLEGTWTSYLPSSWNIQWVAWTPEELQAPRVQWGIAIASVLLTVFLLYTIGVFAANVVGHRVIAVFERILDHLPLIKTVYRATKQILSSFSGEQAANFQRVALVPFPNSDLRSVAFVTGTARDAVTGEELCTCFLASTPNPTTGFVFVLRRKDVIELDWTVEDAVKLIMSGGIITRDRLHFTVNPPAGPPPRSTPAAPIPLGAS